MAVWATLRLQVLRQESGGELPGVGGVVGAVGLLVIGVLELVSGVGEDVNVDRLAQRLHLRFELLYISRRNALVLASEDSQDVGIDLLQRGVIGGEMAVVDDRGFQLRVVDCEIKS